MTQNKSEPGGKSQPGEDRQAESPPALRVLIDADACPVKEEVYKVASRYQVPVTLDNLFDILRHTANLAADYHN